MKKWFKNISYSLAAKMIAMVLWLLFDILAARMLKVNNYAEWVFFYSILTMCFYFGWLGINVSSKVYISKLLPVERNNVIQMTFEIRVIASFAIGVLLLLILPNFAGGLGFPEKYKNLKTLLEILPFIVFFNSIADYYKEVFMGLTVFNKVFAVTVTEYAGFVVFAIALLFLNADVCSLAIAYLLGEMSAALVGFILAGNISFAFRKTGIQKEVVKKILKYAIPIAFLSLGGLVLMEMDTFMLGILSTADNISNYSIAKSICAKAAHVNYALTVGVMTSFAVIEKGGFQKQKRAFSKAGRLNVIIAVLIALALCLFGNLLINILYGSGYPSAGGIIKILTVYYILFSVSNFYSAFLDFRNKAGIRSAFYVSVIVLNLLFNYLWIPKYGAAGAAAATNVSLLPYTIMVVIQSYLEWNKVKKRMEEDERRV